MTHYLKKRRGSSRRAEIKEKVVALHAGQRRIVESSARVVLGLGGTRSGKSFCGPPWLLNEIISRGSGDYLVAAPTSPLLEMAAIPECQRFFGAMQAGDYVGNPMKVYRFNDAWIEQLLGYRPNQPTRIVFRHATDPDSLEAGTFKAAWLDEAGQKAFRIGSWESIQRRLSLHEGRVLITTTPYGLGWLKTQIHDRAVAGDPHYDLIRMRTIDNPMFPVAEYERQRKVMPAWRFRMMYQGIFTRPAGLIYEDFKDHMIVDDASVSIDAKWPRYVGVDFGGINTAAVFFAKNPFNKILYVYADYHAGNRTAREHAAEFKKIGQLHGGSGIPARCVGGSKSEGQWRAEFKAVGYTIHEPDVKEVEVGIDRVTSIIKQGQLRVLRSCVRTTDQLASYSREVDDAGNPTEAIEDKDAQHIADALRYLGGWYAKSGGRVYTAADFGAGDPVEGGMV